MFLTPKSFAPKSSAPESLAPKSSAPRPESSGRVRYVLLGSLTLNLIFVGAAAAMAVQHSNAVTPLQPVVGIPHSFDQHFNRVAASLPPADAIIMRAEFRAQAVKLATAQAQIRLSQEAVRNSLRAQPFDPAAVRLAMDETSAARNDFYQLVHNVVAAATAKMSPAGREMLADWPRRRDKTVITQ
jgi:uncharacterized membrane protein